MSHAKPGTAGDTVTAEPPALEAELEAEREKGLRLRAEFDNFRRRMGRELEGAQRAGERTALRRLLPVLDTLERALQAGSSDRTFYEGVESTQRLFLAALREAGAEPVPAVGRPFDARVHEAVGTAPAAPGVEPGTVVREVRRGWRMGDELMRPAEVVVASAPPPKER